MAINRIELLEDIKLYMRSDNIFTDAQMNKMIDKVIVDVGDTDSNYEEVLCKSLKNIALNNKAQATSSSGLKSRKIEDILEESYYQEGNQSSWDEYLDSLDDVCVSFGYTGLSQFSTGFIGVFTDGGEASVDDEPFIDVNPTSSGCSTTNNLTLPL